MHRIYCQEKVLCTHLLFTIRVKEVMDWKTQAQCGAKQRGAFALAV